jgi:hypothetical protein
VLVVCTCLLENLFVDRLRVEDKLVQNPDSSWDIHWVPGIHSLDTPAFAKHFEKPAGRELHVPQAVDLDSTALEQNQRQTEASAYWAEHKNPVGSRNRIGSVGIDWFGAVEDSLRQMAVGC